MLKKFLFGSKKLVSQMMFSNSFCLFYLKPSLKVQTLARDLPVLRSDRELAIKIGNGVESQVSQKGREM